MWTVLIGAVINIALDPLFIFGLHMGVRGAALATVISQGVSCACVLRFLTAKNAAAAEKETLFRNFKLEAAIASRWAARPLSCSPAKA